MIAVMSNLSAKQLRKAANLADKIEALQHQLNALIGGTSVAAPAAAAAPKKRKKAKFSAAARAAISAAQRARWAKIKAAKK